MARPELLLVGDAGGTKTRLALFEAPLRRGARTGRRGTAVRLIESASFPSGSFPTLEAVATAYLNQTGAHPTRAVFGVAGPVVAGRAEITNLPWRISESGLRRALRLRSARLLNDLVATALAVPVLGPRDVRSINRGTAARGGTIGVIAPGTGLGEAFLAWDGARYRAYPSEGGHSDFAPPTELAGELLTHMRRAVPHVSVEWVCSGMGIPHLYAFLRAHGEAEPAWLAERLASADDPAPVIVGAALDRDRPCPIAAATLDLFIDILGAEAGNLAVKVLATGGVYLAGGIPPKIAGALTDGRFAQAFRRKGRLAELMARIPVRLVVHPDPALIGAVHAALFDSAGTSRP
ncbi:MAG TPA: glucokinase [bacterium]|nr:glucokinase [bacterium]